MPSRPQSTTQARARICQKAERDEQRGERVRGDFVAVSMGNKSQGSGVRMASLRSVAGLGDGAVPRGLVPASE